MIEPIDLTTCPISRERAANILGEEPIGFKAITESGPICLEGCLAPGSSPHAHSTVVQWMIVGTTTIAWVDVVTDLVTRSAMLHPFPHDLDPAINGG